MAQQMSHIMRFVEDVEDRNNVIPSFILEIRIIHKILNLLIRDKRFLLINNRVFMKAVNVMGKV